MRASSAKSAHRHLERLRRIAPNLNFDMIASPNYAEFVHDGDDSDEARAARYGGRAGVALDPNCHAAGDDLKNLNLTAFDTGIDGIAHAVGTYAEDLSTLGAPAVRG